MRNRSNGYSHTLYSRGNSSNKGMVTVLVIVALIVGSIVGWCLNAYKLCNLDFKKPYKAEIIRTIGLVIPISPVIGYITFEEEVKK